MGREFENISGRCRELILGTCLVLMAILFCVKAFGLLCPAELHGAQQPQYADEVSFTFTSFDKDGKVVFEEEGAVTMLQNKFRLEVEDEFIMVTDGSTLWVYKVQSDDIIIMEYSSRSADRPIENSILNLAELFGYSEASGNRMEMKKNADGKPAEIIFHTADDSMHRVKIKSVKVRQPLQSSKTFILDSNDYPNAIITDLR